MELLDRLYIHVYNYRSFSSYNSIFKEISEVFYYENYHSDILRYYLKHRLVKKYFINWLNECISDNKLKIDAKEYYDGDIRREKNKIDITLFNHNSKKAIIIENKSNDAKDQIKQIHTYLNKLKNININVEAIFYLNKSTLKFPDLTDLSKNQRKEILDILTIGKLVGEASFVEKVINSVISDTNDIRLNGLSQEIRDLFFGIVYGEFNMETMEDFISELADDSNYEKLSKILQAYNDIPEYLTNKYMEYINKKHSSYYARLANENQTVAIDITSKCDSIFIDINPNFEKVEFIISMRDGAKGKIKNLKNKISSNWVFDNDNKLIIENPIKNDIIVKEVIDKIINCLNYVKKARALRLTND